MRHLLLTTLLIFGATVVSAEIKAGEILGTGKVINQFDQPSKRNGKLILIHKVYVDYQSNLYECIINKTEGNIKCVVNDWSKKIFMKPFVIKTNSEWGITFMDQYTKTLLTIITVCVVIVTLIIVGSVIIHDHDDEHDGDYHEYMEHIIERLESIEERLD